MRHGRLAHAGGAHHVDPEVGRGGRPGAGPGPGVAVVQKAVVVVAAVAAGPGLRVRHRAAGGHEAVGALLLERVPAVDDGALRRRLEGSNPPDASVLAPGVDPEPRGGRGVATATAAAAAVAAAAAGSPGHVQQVVGDVGHGVTSHVRHDAILHRQLAPRRPLGRSEGRGAGVVRGGGGGGGPYGVRGQGHGGDVEEYGLLRHEAVAAVVRGGGAQPPVGPGTVVVAVVVLVLVAGGSVAAAATTASRSSGPGGGARGRRSRAPRRGPGPRGGFPW